jgi:Tol biopolymer transport system component
MYFKDRHYEGEPFITRDGKTLYFMAVLPPAEGEKWNANQYRVHRNGKSWSAPETLDSTINSKGSEWHISITDRGILYFTSEREKETSALYGDIYRAEIKQDHFVNLTKLPYPINTEYNDSDPLIAPDESFLIFHSDRPGGFGEHDLYICFNRKGKWSVPINMGKTINTDSWEMAPSLTPDGKYLLFTRRKAMVTDEPARIYWVSSSILKRYENSHNKITNQ